MSQLIGATYDFPNLNFRDMKTQVFRLLPGQDLKDEIRKVVLAKGIQAGWIVTCVGSLSRFNLRFANSSEGTQREGFFEIVSLTGTLSIRGSHLHISAADMDGMVSGGHLLDGNIVYTTAEIVIGYDESLAFSREKDGTTEWAELQIKNLNL